MKNKIIAIIQCRLNSRRLPNKAILKLNKVPVIIRMLNRVKKSKLINEIWVATGISKENDKLCKLLKKIFVSLEEMIITSYQDLWI